MAKLIPPIGRVVGGSYDGSFIYWLIEKDQTEYFAVSPNDRLRIGMFVRIDDNPITFEIVYTKNRGKILMRVNRQAADKLRAMSDEKKRV